MLPIALLHPACSAWSGVCTLTVVSIGQVKKLRLGERTCVTQDLDSGRM